MSLDSDSRHDPSSTVAEFPERRSIRARLAAITGKLELPATEADVEARKDKPSNVAEINPELANIKELLCSLVDDITADPKDTK